MKEREMNFQQRFLEHVWPRIDDFFKKYSQASYKTWFGPIIWNENGDLLRMVTRFCEEEFGIFSVHNEAKVGLNYFKNFEEQFKAGERGKQTYSIDIDITDIRECKNLEGFKNLKHGYYLLK